MSAPSHGPAKGSQPTLFEYVETGTGVAGNINNFVLNPISASEAFRKYNWLKGAPLLNKSGNLRGMVINARMRTVYNVTKQGGDYLALMSILMEVGKEMSRIQEVCDSDADDGEKASRALLLGSAAILRSVTSIVPTAVHLLAKSAQGYAQLYSLVSGSPSGNRLSEKIGQFDKEVSTIHSRQWDGENWYNVIEAVID